jgi:hypothetical protein
MDIHCNVHANVHRRVHTRSFCKFLSPREPGQSQAGGAEAQTCRRRALTARDLSDQHNGVGRPDTGRLGCASRPGLPTFTRREESGELKSAGTASASVCIHEAALKKRRLGPAPTRVGLSDSIASDPIRDRGSLSSETALR